MTATSNVQNSAQTGTDGCVRKQNTDNEQFLPASIQFSIGFHQLAYKKGDNKQFLLPGKREFRITQRLSRLSHFIFQSTFFQINISTNKLLVYSLKKFHHVWFLSLHCTGFNCGEVFILCLEEKVRISATSSSPLCKETPGVYIAWERLRPKIGPVSDDLQRDATTFPFSTLQHCLLGEFRVKLEGKFWIFARSQSVSRISIERIDWTPSVSI